MNTVPIYKLARTVRSKNAGYNHLTFEIIFSERSIYEKVKRSGAVSREVFAETYRLDPAEVVLFVWYDPGLAIKATIVRPMVSGSPGESDVYGAQQYAPLFDLPVPWEGELPDVAGDA
jgi:hypothetical protein